MRTMSTSIDRRRLGGRAARAAAALLAAPAACRAPWTAGRPEVALLYVANGRDGTVSRLDARSGRAVGDPVPAGPAPAQLAAGSGGSLLVLPAGGPEWRLTHVTPPAGAAGAPAVRAVPLKPGGVTGRLAGDGRDGAALVYHVPGSSGASGASGVPPGGRRLVCRLALLDVVRGTVVRTHTVDSLPGIALAVALAPGPPGPVAYLADWHPAGAVDGRWRPGRVRAVDPATGAALAGADVPGAPVQLRLGPAPGGAGRRLYCLVDASGRWGGGAESEPNRADHWRLLGLDPATLQPEHEYPLPDPVSALTVAPDGGAAYPLEAVGQRGVVRVDLRTGAVDRLAALPGTGVDLAATRERVYVADGRGAVWALDARGGALVHTLAVGRGPVGLALRGRT
jgi:hypothetical protein